MRRVLALAVLLVACKEDPVVLATLPPSDRPPNEERCGGDDCARGTYCEKPECDAPVGMCLPFPTVCPADEAPVCGCDGVTYFNDCLRRAAGAGAAHAGECVREALGCGDVDGECPAGAVCSLLTGGDERECTGAFRGRCWVIPPACPPPSATDRWRPCLPIPPMGPEPPPPPPPCIDTCSAIRSGAPHVRAFRCE